MKNSIASRKLNTLKKTASSEWNDQVNAELEIPTPTCLLDAIEVVVEYAANSGLCPAFYKRVESSLDYLASRLEITPSEALMLSVAVNAGPDIRLALSNIADFFECSRVKVLKFTKDLDTLFERKYLRRVVLADRETSYFILYDVMESIQNDQPYSPRPQTKLDAEQLFDEIHNLIRTFKARKIDFETFVEDIDSLISFNHHLQFCQAFKALSLNVNNKILLIRACDLMVNKDDEIILFDDFDDLYESQSAINHLHKELLNGTSDLVKKGIIERYPEDGFMSRDVFQLTNKARCELLSELGITESTKQSARQKDLVKPTSITTKNLFYNPSEQQQISRLESLLQPESFDNICQRLGESGMRKGFACLFYGVPGTGKTETVLQLARKTGRSLMQVNISEIKDMFVGQSEKNIKQIFDRYRWLVEHESVAPILFFNEADAIINKRTQNTERAVDKMENALQNIILQEIESLEGILIATTNLATNLDPAFERRFIYKIEFSAPTLAAKQYIWQSMIPSLDKEEAATLASAYNFSGGQIENIARKQTVEYILTGEQPTLATICRLCDAECLYNVPQRRAIGF